MRMVDANILLYAIDERSPRHAPAKAWVKECLSGSETVGFAWNVLLTFLRLSTNGRIFENALPVDEAFDIVDGWLAQPCAAVVHPTERHSVLMRQMLAELGTAGNLTSDAHLAALAVEHGAELCSCDSDFSRFPRLRWTNPLN